MATFNGDARDNLWVIIEPGTYVIDGRGGTDTIDFGTSQRSSYDIYVTEDGVVHVDSVSGASGGDSSLLRGSFINIELFQFDSRRDTLNVATLIGDIAPPTLQFSDNTPGVAIGAVTYSLGFSEAVTGLVADAFAVSQGQVVSVSGSGALWSVVVQPTIGTEGVLGLTLKSAGVVDTANNPNAAASAAPQPFDTLSPRLLSGNPGFGESGVEPGANLVLSFSENVRRGSGNVTLRDAAGNAVESFDAATSPRLTFNGASLTLDPTRELAPGSGFTLDFGSTSVLDAAGNALVSPGLVPYTFSSAPASTATALMGTRLAESFTPAAAVLSIDGFGGIDSVTLPGASTAYRLSGSANESANTFNVSALDASRSLSLTHVERLVFDNQHLAIDLDGNAGTVAKILGAVFGRDSVHNATYAGIGLGLLDSGTSYPALMQLALDVRLGALASHTAVVDLLYTNVIGTPPPAPERSFYVGLLDSRAYTPAALGVLAADTDFNKVAIDLIGLAQSGLPFIPA